LKTRKQEKNDTLMSLELLMVLENFLAQFNKRVIMPILNKTKIIRCPFNPSGSYNAPDCREVDEYCHVNANVEEKISLTFNIQVGRGETELHVEINKADFSVILEEMAKSTPEAATLFSKYAKKSLELNNNFNQLIQQYY